MLENVKNGHMELEVIALVKDRDGHTHGLFKKGNEYIVGKFVREYQDGISWASGDYYYNGKAEAWEDFLKVAVI